MVESNDGDSGCGEVPARSGVAEVRRRRSPIDPPDGAWAVLGLGVAGRAVLAAFELLGIPVVGYEGRPLDEPSDAATAGWPKIAVTNVRYGHVVVDLEEIEDIDLLAVTSLDWRDGEINTDYFAGVVVAASGIRGCDEFWVSERPEVPGLLARLFPSENPMILATGGSVTRGAAMAESPEASAGLGSARTAVDEQRMDTSDRQQADRQESGEARARLLAEYVSFLRDQPREAFTFHRAMAGFHEGGVPATLQSVAREIQAQTDEIQQVKSARFELRRMVSVAS